MFLTNPIEKDEVKVIKHRYNKDCTPQGNFIVVPSIKEWPIKTNETLSHHEPYQNMI